VEKAIGLGADVVILDLEDAVAVSEKKKYTRLNK
jgi:citrate lyase beta subunit